MSLQTWKAEFYPIDAEKVAKEDALAHSLRKWIGLRPKNLKRHKCRTLDDEWLGPCVAGPRGCMLPIVTDSCALCTHYFSDDDDDTRARSAGDCPSCPLALVRGAPCDVDLFTDNSPYSAFSYEGNPEPMIALIESAIASQKAATQS